MFKKTLLTALLFFLCITPSVYAIDYRYRQMPQPPTPYIFMPAKPYYHNRTLIYPKPLTYGPHYNTRPYLITPRPHYYYHHFYWRTF